MSQKPVELSAVIAQAIEQAGGVGAVASAISKTREAVRLWRVRGKVPDKHLIQLERLSGVPRERLRPDLFAREQPLVERRHERSDHSQTEEPKLGA